MHILFVAPYPPGSTRPRSRNLLRQMTSHGHRVTVVALSIARLHGDEIGIPGGLEGLSLVHRTRARAYLAALGALGGGTPLEVAFGASHRWRSRVTEAAERAGCDLLHVEHIRAAAAGFPADIPKVWDAVDSRSLLWERAAASGPGLAKVLGKIEAPRSRRFEAIAAGRYDSVLVSSSQDRDVFRRLASKVDPVIIPNGVDLEYFGQREWAPQAGEVVMTGVMSYAPNVEAAVRFTRLAWPNVASRRPDAHLRLVGSTPARAVRRLAGPSVTVTGYVEDMRPFLSRAMVAICPTRIGAGTQYKILEAMAAGVPVVASSSAAMALELVAGDHLLVADGPGELAEAVLALMGDRALAQRLRSAAFEVMRERFTWDRVGDALDEVHRTVAGRRR